MPHSAYYFVQPLDVLMLRGNKSFGAAGEHGEAVMPPWPSVFAGAFRSALLAQDASRLAAFVALGTHAGMAEPERSAQMRDLLGDNLYSALGTPSRPGDFRVTWVSLAAQQGRAAAIPLPADLLAFDDAGTDPLVALQPSALPAGLRVSGGLPLIAVPRVHKQIKPQSGRWLAGSGIAAHATARLTRDTPTVATGDLYRRETRLGIGLDADSRTASDGAIYTTQAVAFADHAGLLVGIAGDHGQMPADGLLRLGGDGKAARFQRVSDMSPLPTDIPPVEPGGRFRLILTTPALFGGGWLPERVQPQADGSFRLAGEGFSARLACAALARHEVVSGWDLAHWRPKTAQRVAPAGSVYWFDHFEGDGRKLAAWVAGGLWGENPDMQRRAEGFNNAMLCAWP